MVITPVTSKAKILKRAVKRERIKTEMLLKFGIVSSSWTVKNFWSWVDFEPKVLWPGVDPNKRFTLNCSGRRMVWYNHDEISRAAWR